MGRTTPHVEQGRLTVGPPGAERTIDVGTPAWFEWLSAATAFSFTCQQGTYTARRERASSRRGGWYWRAYQRRGGGLQRAYLGKAEELTLERLQAVAASLASADALEHTSDRSAADVGRPIGESIEHFTLPTGTATFLFTDIEGSTQLWEQHKEAMQAALARHDSLLRQAIGTHGGVIFKTVGDSAHAVFARAADALAAALSAQRALQQEAWDSTGPLRVRMALHTGAAELREGDYFGPPLNRLARILALGHGGQILLSRATHDLVVDDLPSQTSLRALGEYALKDLTRPEPLFQLVSPDLPADFPPLRGDDPRAGTGAPSLNLLATKLYIPQEQPTLVARPRLLERMQSGLGGKLTLIAAPAGFGKTTLLSEWIADFRLQIVDYEGADPNLQSTIYNLQSPRVAWLSLDPMDNDPTTFLRYLIAALQTIVPDIGATALVLLRSPQLPPIDTLMTALLNDAIALPQAALLVLDDYHVITTPAIHQALAFLLDHLPPQLHLVIATREDPPLPLARLRARGQLAELRAADLRFMPDEATSFLTDTMMLPLTTEAIAALETRTEGWIAGLQLAALAMRDRNDLEQFVAAFTGSNRFVVDYLMEEVFSRQPAHIQTFLLQTAILDRMCGPLCDALLGLETRDLRLEEADAQQASSRGALWVPQASQAVLEELERTNLFVVPLDDERCWYRYHHLFAEMLRGRFASGRAALTAATLHQRASTWFERQGLITETVQHALHTQDFDRATHLIEAHGLSIAVQGQLHTVFGWLHALPEPLIRARPSLCVLYATILASTNQLDAAERRLFDAEQAIALTMRGDEARSIQGLAVLLRANIIHISGDFRRSVALAQQALDVLPESDVIVRAAAMASTTHIYKVTGDVTPATERTVKQVSVFAHAAGNTLTYVAAMTNLAEVHIRQGRLRQAAATYRELEQAAPQPLGLQALVNSAPYYFGMGGLLHEWNDLEAAEAYLKQGMEMVHGSLTVAADSVTQGYLTLARLQQARADIAGARATLDAFVQLAEQRNFVAPLIAQAAAAQAQLRLAQGQLDAAVRWAATSGLTPNDDLTYAREAEYLTLARLLIAQRRDGSTGDALQEPLHLLDRLLAAAKTGGRMGSAIQILVVRALTLHAQTNVTEALSSLEQALSLAEPEGYVRVFVDEGPPMAELLREAQQHGIAPEYIAKLLAAFPEAQSAKRRAQNNDTPALRDRSLEPSSALIEPLTARELDVLRLLAAGASNGAIAEALIISIGTAKKHVNNILAKLDVRSRTQAALWAREHGLLAERSES
jgi:LuxR family maltose regulon positive regulatory protein